MNPDNKDLRRIAGEATAEPLKPCPFCGGEATTIIRPGAWGVRCNAGHFVHTYGSTQEAAVAAWNRRTPNSHDALASEVERLKGALKPFADAATHEEKCIDPDYGIARVRPLRDTRRIAVTLGECRAARAALEPTHGS